MAVIAGMHHPAAILLTDDAPDMMRPDHDGADMRVTRRTVMHPLPGEIIGRIRDAHLLAHLPAAPGVRARAHALEHVYQSDAQTFDHWIDMPMMVMGDVVMVASECRRGKHRRDQ